MMSLVLEAPKMMALIVGFRAVCGFLIMVPILISTLFDPFAIGRNKFRDENPDWRPSGQEPMTIRAKLVLLGLLFLACLFLVSL